jgi:ABC-type bacteriocin/lantibiotic exporter with double-glycine peptidase domain
MGRQAATFENVKWVVKNLGLEKFIRSLPKGYDTHMDPEGKRIPKSIVEKIILARSMADKPKLLLLEDAFEHMSNEDRKEVIDFIYAPENEWTVISVNSDPYLAQKSTRIYVMDEGKIVQEGSYDDFKNSNHLKGI